MTHLPGLPHLPLERLWRRRWADDPLWASVYDWTVEHDRVGGLLWRLGTGSALRELHETAAAEVAALEAGARVLDCPSGGGVALRTLRRDQDVDWVAVDIAEPMLDRTRRAAEKHGVADQVRLVPADVASLPFADASFDLVVTMTGLHCFPDPRQALAELVRVLKPAGTLVGSAVLADAPLQHQPLLVGGRLSGLIGPSLTAAELRAWLLEDGMSAVHVRRSGALGYVRAVRSVHVDRADVRRA